MGSSYDLVGVDRERWTSPEDAKVAARSVRLARRKKKMPAIRNSRSTSCTSSLRLVDERVFLSLLGTRRCTNGLLGKVNCWCRRSLILQQVLSAKSREAAGTLQARVQLPPGP